MAIKLFTVWNVEQPLQWDSLKLTESVVQETKIDQNHYDHSILQSAVYNMHGVNCAGYYSHR